MTFLPITSLTAALAAIMLVVLSGIAGAGRVSSKIMLGDGGDPALLRRIRAHGNFIEYVPTGLILLGLCEMAATSMGLLWALAVLLLLGRLIHAVGILAGVLPARGLGMMLNHGALLIGAVTLIGDYFR